MNFNKQKEEDLTEAFKIIDKTNMKQVCYTNQYGFDIICIDLLSNDLANELFKQLKNSVEYYDGELTKVRVFGKWHQIPRQQSAYGDSGLHYKFSGVCLPAKEWIPPLLATKNLLSSITGYDYNFVLINKYRNGSDHMGEHRDDEAELDPNTPIASLTLGQRRPFIFKHVDSRKKCGDKKIEKHKIYLEHGSLLLMNPPTNKYWYHSLPVCKKAPGERINLTFRKITT